MTRVLVVAYFFPPVGGAGVQRWVRLATHLPERGIEPVILTGSGAAAGAWRPADPSAEPPGLEVVRTPGPEPLPSWRGVRAWARRPNAWTRWWEASIRREGPGLAAGCEAIVATMSPFESAGPVAEVAASAGVPWIADLRDPWAIDEMRTFHTALHRSLELRRMGELLRRADAVVMNTAESRRRVLEAGLGLDPARVHVITNGAYPRDASGDPAPDDAGPFTIVHAGKLHTSSGRRLRRDLLRNRLLGGTAPGLDLLPRSHAFLLEALGRIRPPVRLDLIGDLSPADRTESARHGASVIVRHLGYLPRGETRARLDRADMLFLPMHATGGRRATIVPEKTYEYLASGRPILAAVPAGDARDLLTGNDRAYVCDPTDVTAMSAAVRREMAIKAGGAGLPVRRDAVLAPLHPAALAARMADVVSTVARGHRSSAARPGAPRLDAVGDPRLP